MLNSQGFNIEPIAKITTPFTQKFGIPRQSLLAQEATGQIVFREDIDAQLACEGIMQFSHIWLLFIFHEHVDKAHKLRVRPPRLGGNQYMGVFASRSSFRPNNIGLSVVKNLGLKGNVLEVAGVDLLDNTPLIDIKPYIRYADAIDDAVSGYAQEAPKAELHIDIPLDIQEALNQHKLPVALVKTVLAQDPRPAYKAKHIDAKDYVIQLYGIDIRWRFIDACHIEITGLSPR